MIFKFSKYSKILCTLFLRPQNYSTAWTSTNFLKRLIDKMMMVVCSKRRFLWGLRPLKWWNGWNSSKLFLLFCHQKIRPKAGAIIYYFGDLFQKDICKPFKKKFFFIEFLIRRALEIIISLMIKSWILRHRITKTWTALDKFCIFLWSILPNQYTRNTLQLL